MTECNETTYSKNLLNVLTTKYGFEADKCADYKESLNEALNIATTETLKYNTLDMLKTLWNEHSIKIPWIPYTKDKDQLFNNKLWTDINVYFHRLTNAAEQLTRISRYKMGKVIFESQIEGFDNDNNCISDINNTVWELYSYYMASNFNPSFVLIPKDTFGDISTTHIALKIETDNNETTIVDPTYGIYDLKGLPTIDLDLVQALSLYYTIEALCSETPKEQLDLARRVDPNNKTATIYWMSTINHLDDPLAPYRAIQKHSIETNRDALNTSVSTLNPNLEE